MRTRDLKPDFWTDERVVSVSDGAKLLFQGLWCLADREGRLEDKPITIGFKIRPWDPQATPGLLAELAEIGLIVRYEVAGGRFIGIPGLKTHQRIHPKEMASKLPDWAGLETSREKVNLSAASRGKNENYVSQSGSSGSSEPAGPTGSAQAKVAAAPLELLPVAPSEKPVEEQVFEHWRTVMGKTRGALFTKDRRDKVRARLAEGHSVADLKLAVDGCAKTPHNMGDNETGERWDDLELICRNGANVERFMRNATAPPNRSAARAQNGKSPIRAEDMPAEQIALVGDVSSTF